MTKKLLYVQTTDSPDKQYSPLILAQTAKAMDIEPIVYYLGTALKILKSGEAEKIQMGNFPSVKEMIDKTLEAGITVLVCEASKRMLGWDTVELIPGVKIVGAATLNDLVLESDGTLWF